MDKTIPLTLDVYKPVDPGNCFKIWRGDSVVFNFTFKGNGTDIPPTDADKLRVFAKRIMPGGDVDKDAQPLFAADFTDPITKASFGSTQTAGDAGYYLMTVMLMKGETVVTAQGIKFELLENGYAGIYQPSEDFRDEVVDAKNQAQAAAEAAADSATAAGNSSSAAASSASSADASAQQAAQDKSAVSEMKTSVENTKTQIDNTAKQVAQDRAAAEAAAGTAVNATDLAALCRRAANVGFFQFDGGNAALAKAISSLPLSMAFMFQKTGDIANYTLYAGNNALGNASNAGICIAKNNGNTSVVQLRTESGGTLSQGYFNDTSLLDGKLHSVVVIVTDKLSLYIDGLAVSFSSGSWTGISASEIATPRTFYVGNGSGYALSRVKIFNFDMTAEGAPYTVADYAAGIEPSPAFMRGGVFYDLSLFGSYNSTTITSCAVADGIMTIVKNAGSVAYVTFPLSGAIDPGETVELILVTDTNPYLVGLLPSATYVSADIERFGSINPTNGKYSFAASKRLTHLGIMLTSTTTTLNISQLTIRRNGAVLALSDAADASQIRDKSGNGNHALMSGTVLPSKNNNPARCSQTISWAGTSTLQNVCGDAAIPANSKVTAYAKATGALTASFKAGANTAQSKELAANTLTEIGSWLCEASGAFSVQPSAAYTGSIETYLTIERL